MRRTTRLCKQCGTRPPRQRRGAAFCTPCVTKMAKLRCETCNTDFQPDMMATKTRCKGCQRTRNHGARIKATYSITSEDYAAILARQGGGCAICGRVLTRRNYCVDHDHACCSGPTSCGKCVRGLICSTDNKYLGYIRDNPEAALRMAQYLVDPPAQRKS